MTEFNPKQINSSKLLIFFSINRSNTRDRDQRVHFPPPKTVWTGLSLPKSRKTWDFTASTLEGWSSSASDEDDEMQSLIFWEILPMTESGSPGWSAMDLCSKIEDQKMEMRETVSEAETSIECEMQREGNAT